MAKPVKHDSGKLRFDLVPPEAERAIADVLTYGAEKYGDRNWELAINDPAFVWRLYGAMRRHMNLWKKGEELDESGRPHSHHALCCLAMLVTIEERLKR